MLNLRLKLDGLSEALKGLNVLPAGIKEQNQVALKGWGDFVLLRSKPLVPYKSGALRDSGKVHGPETDKGVLVLTIGYGDRKAWYAGIVHERLDVRHTTGQAKYLEQPINENAPRLDGALSHALETALRNSFK